MENNKVNKNIFNTENQKNVLINQIKNFKRYFNSGLNNEFDIQNDNRFKFIQNIDKNKEKIFTIFKD